MSESGTNAKSCRPGWRSLRLGETGMIRDIAKTDALTHRDMAPLTAATTGVRKSRRLLLKPTKLEPAQGASGSKKWSCP